MPYFLFRLSPGTRPTLIDTFGKFQEAKGQARKLRTEQPAGGSQQIRIIFAEDSHKALILVTDTRSARTDGDD